MLRGGETVLVGLSGGPDSVCLLRALDIIRPSLNLSLYALYIDHGLRPDETPMEIDFCKNLCERLSVPFIHREIDVKGYALMHGLGKQEAGRELRYALFDEVSASINARKVALGHTADDRAETFIMRLLRGAGTKGLSGIPPVRKNIIRPLIDVERREIEKFLGKEEIGFIVDSSNLAQDYLRNRIRHSIVPALKEINPEIIETISRTAEILEEEERYLEIQVTKVLMKLITRKSDFGIELFITPLETMDKVILRRVVRRAISETRGLRGISMKNVEDIIKLIKEGSSGSRICLPGGMRVIKKYSTLLITSEKSAALGTYELRIPGEVVIREGEVMIKASVTEEMPETDTDRTKAVFDAGKVKSTLIIRSRREGDFFYPSGFGRRKKLQDFFVDEKVPRDERDSVPLALSGDEIVWIAGRRQDGRFAPDKNTARFLLLELRWLHG
jgi:tRNA(Ile)-lysidine synthase